MKFMFYYANRLNTIFAKALLKKKINSKPNFINFYINIFTKNVLIPTTILNFLKTNIFFKKTVANYFIKKKLFFKEKKKTKFFFFRKKKILKNNYFQNKKSCSFIFINFLDECNALNKKTEFNSFFFFFLLISKFFTNELFNYLKITLNELDLKKINCFFFLKIFKQFNINNISKVYYYNIDKHSDFWQIILNFIVNSTVNLKIIPSYLNMLCLQEKVYVKIFNLNFKNLSTQDSLKTLFSFFFKKKEINDFNTENLKLNFNFFFFFRKNNLYNKGKFSRNRQTYRTGVFLCIWLTILTVIGMYFYFLMLSIKFTYLIVFFIFFIFLFFYKYWFFASEKKTENHGWLFFY